MELLSATPAGTGAYRDRFKGRTADSHFREVDGLWLSSIGLGTYLGHHDAATDQSYRTAIKRALELGCNVLDTAANYRFQRSERVIGEVLREGISSGQLARREVVIATKGGYLPFDGAPPQSRQEMADYLNQTFFEPGICAPDDFVQNSHSIAPSYLAHQLDQSLRNLGLETIDVYYLHNPETQLTAVTREEFRKRSRSAFKFLEEAVGAGKIASYGIATWNGLRVARPNPEFLGFEELVMTAREVAGAGHHFRTVQLPFNISMTEALTFANQPLGASVVPLLKAASELGVTVMTSASILQARLATGLAPRLTTQLSNLRTDAQRALQFARSAPRVTTALTGMARIAHVEENLEIAKVPLVPEDEYLKLLSALNK